MKRVKNKYKFYSGVQQITPDTPDYTEVEDFKIRKNAQEQGIKNATAQFSGAYAPIGQLGGMAGDVIKSRNKSKGGAQLGGAVSMGASGAALGAQLGGPWGAAAGLVAGGIYGAATGGAEYDEGIKKQKQIEYNAQRTTAQNEIKQGHSTDAQSFLNSAKNSAKKGKYKLKSKEPRPVEWEGGTNPDGTEREEGSEAVFGPKMKNGKRKLLFYNPKAPTHEAGGVPGVVVPKEMYKNGTSNLSHRKENPDINRVINPPVPYELKPKPEKSRYEKGGKYVKVYKEGSKGVSLAFSRGEKDPKGGLTQKGVDKYNRATGGNLKMAVTTPPSKLKAGSKDANRRKSFCSRMKGMKSKLTSAKTANDPNSRINKSLRKWNC